MNYRLRDLLDIPRLRKLLDSLDEIHSFPSAIIDIEGTVLTANAWQDICTQFHRVNPETEKKCLESDRHIGARLSASMPHVLFRCPMGLIDAAMPIVIEGEHLGNVFTGQLFLEPPEETYFINQARQYGFDEDDYVAAMRKVPFFTEEKLLKNLTFIHSLTQLLTEQGLQYRRQCEAEVMLRENEATILAMKDSLQEQYEELQLNEESLRDQNDELLVTEEMLRVQINEYKTSQKLLKESEERFRALHDATFGGIIIHDKGIIYDCNQGLSDMTGYTSEELIGMDGFKLIAPEWLDLVMRNIEIGFDHSYEVVGVRKDGSKYPLAIHGKNIPYSGRIVRVIEFRDITERKQTEDALRKNEAKQRAMIDNSVDVIGIVDKDGICQYKSHNIVKWFGWQPDEVVGEATWKNVHPDDLERVQRLINSLVEVPSASTTTEYRYRCKDGSYKWIECTAVNLLHDPDISGVLLNYHDISEPKRGEEALQHEQLFSKTIVDSLPGIFYLYAYPELRLIRWNKQHESLLGYKAGEIEGRHITDWHPPEAKESVLAAVETAMTRGHYSIETLLLTKDGRLVPFFLNGVRLEAQGQSYILGIGLDISERQRTERELQKKNAELEQFIYTISHDLRSPLVTIKTFLGFLETDLTGGNRERIAQDMHFIHSAADKMKLLLDELLEMSRIDRIETPPVRVSIRELLAEVLETLAGAISERKADIHLPDRDLTLFCDRPRLYQIWQNLIENALKYSHNCSIPRIELGIMQIKGENVFFVKDQGIGIDPQYFTKIFGIFEKLDSNSSGAGLGLSMVQRIVDKYGGKVWVESEGSGKGSCFFFTLPQMIVQS